MRKACAGGLHGARTPLSILPRIFAGKPSVLTKPFKLGLWLRCSPVKDLLDVDGVRGSSKWFDMLTVSAWHHLTHRLRQSASAAQRISPSPFHSSNWNLNSRCFTPGEAHSSMAFVLRLSKLWHVKHCPFGRSPVRLKLTFLNRKNSSINYRWYPAPRLILDFDEAEMEA